MPTTPAAKETPRSKPWKGETPPADDPAEHRAKRRHAMRLRQLSQRITRSSAHGGCGRRAVLSGDVLVYVGESGRAHLSGVMTCGQLWECAVCRVSGMRERAARLVGAANAWRAWTCQGCGGVHAANVAACDACGPDVGRFHGGETFLLTLTMRRPDGAPSLDHHLFAWDDAWRAFQSTRAWRRIKRHPWVRALEITAGFDRREPWEAMLWHVHGHILLFLPRGLSPDAAEALRRELADAWADTVREHVGRAWEPRRDAEWCDRTKRLRGVGLDLAPTSATNYLTKLGLEIASGATSKEGRKWGRFSMWQVLAMTSAKDETAKRWGEKTWRTFIDAMRAEGGRSRSALQTNASIRPLLEAVEVTEERGTLVASIPGAVYRTIARRVAWLEVVLETCERGEARTLAEALARAQLPRWAVAQLSAHAAAREHEHATFAAALVAPSDDFARAVA